MTQRKILITGANGLLGQALIDRLKSPESCELLVTSRDPDSVHPAKPRHAPLDIRDTDEVRRLLDTFSPDVVVNCAAMTQVDTCEDKRMACWAINAAAVEDLAELCRQTNTHLVHLSTDFIFDGQEGPYRETAKPNPVNFYGESKLAGERAIRDSGLEQWSIARTVLVYGTAYQLKRSNIALWLIDELTHGRSVHIVTDQWRTPTYVSDLAAGIQRIIDRRAQGIYHLSGSEFLTVYQFAQQLAQCYEFDTSLIHPVKSETLGQQAQRPSKTGFIIDKARTELDFQPHSIESALQDLGTILDLRTTA